MDPQLSDSALEDGERRRDIIRMENSQKTVKFIYDRILVILLLQMFFIQYFSTIITNNKNV